MRCEFKAVMLSGLILTLIGVVDLTPGQLGKSLSTVAEASEWSEGIVKAVNGLPAGEGQEKGVEPVTIKLDDGRILPLDPKARITDTRGNPIPLESFISPSKIRFLLEKGVVKEMVLIEALPR